MNKIVVQKYGGTSIGDVEKLKAIAKKVSDKKEAGFFPICLMCQLCQIIQLLYRSADEQQIKCNLFNAKNI